MGIVQRVGTSLSSSSHSAWPPASTPFFSLFSNPIHCQLEASTTADAVDLIHALCLTKQQQRQLAKHLCKKPSTHPSSGSMSDWNDVFLSVRATLSFTCISCQGICPCQQCACFAGFECPMLASLVCAHTSQHCGTVVAACNGFSMTPSSQHICPFSLFIARPFAGYRAIGFRPPRFMVLRLLGDTSKNIWAKWRQSRTSMSSIRSHSLAGLRAQGPHAGVADL